MTDIHVICGHVRDIAKDVGRFVRKEACKVDSDHVEVKSMNSLVTYVDKQAELQIVNELQKLLPEAGFITEENTCQKKGDVYHWVIDPLDGTTNFIHGIPFYSVSIALMKQQEIVLGVVYEPNLKECFHAVAGHGAFLNNRPIRVSDSPDTSSSLLATGFPYHDYNQLDDFLDLFKWCMINTRGLRRLGSAAVDLAYVACGRFDGFFEYGLNSWDVAAGCLIVQEAGGKVSDFRRGNNYVFGGEIVATNKHIYEGFMMQINKSFRKKT